MGRPQQTLADHIQNRNEDCARDHVQFTPRIQGSPLKKKNQCSGHTNGMKRDPHTIITIDAKEAVEKQRILRITTFRLTTLRFLRLGGVLYETPQLRLYLTV